MDNRFRYHRSFLIFTQEDSRNGEGREPSGYVKIEVKDGKGRLSCQLSNLKESNDSVYKLYLIKANESSFMAVCPGVIPLARGKGELNWSFSPADIGGIGLSVDDINIAAVILENNEQYIDNILCPLAAYKNGKIEWRQRMKKFLNKQREGERKQNEEREEAKETARTKEVQRTEEDVLIETQLLMAHEDIKKDEDITSKYESVIESIYRKEDKKGDIGAIAEDDSRINDNMQKEEAEVSKLPIEELPENDKVEDEGIRADDKNDNGVCMDDEQKREDEIEDEDKNENREENEIKAQIKDESDAKREFCNKISFEELVKKFDRCFEKCNPFMAGRKDYIWWKIASPVHLNNILYQMKIDVPILFNPLVLMAHFKYRHLLVGIYEDKTRNLRYIVCGVPGVYWVDEKPFGKMCRWAQVNGNIPKYGAFGYWLVYINPDTGEILNVS
ncbi:MAG TPA: hypothetical protein PLH43_06790 [Acetivibrio sp.]|uniref:DUF7922 domain-containing protein n=1 Tax=Acetivibrio sp. TaxID=1872092 RepID=UPI002C8885DE|nr:hypothetical protein [Acetivibrio sp.]HOM02519.1 hypothetical protein [Acetivibrio sp.]